MKTSGAHLACAESGNGAVTFTLSGRLDVATTGDVWRDAMSQIDALAPERLIVDAGGLEYCDGAGASFLSGLRERMGGRVEIRSFPEAYRGLLRIFDGSDLAPLEDRGAGSPLESLGRATVQIGTDIRELVVFCGELLVASARAIATPSRIRWREALRVAEAAGVNALPIVSLIGLLLGLVLAYQSANSLAAYGADLYVPDLLGVSLVRELGPLMTAILLAGRTGSSFAAEIGTMKVNEEIDAMTTMGLQPVRFLAVTRVFAAVLMMPILTAFCILSGLVGGAFVFVLGLGYPFVLFTSGMFQLVSADAFFASLLKTIVFAVLIAGVGCQRGLRTGAGARAVGESTTSAVVAGILLIAIADAIFSVVLHSLGI